MNQLQQEELKILKYYHAFAEEHNLQYSLCAGTLLGAIRHQGFIPWDDDIDVMMRRSEFEKFENLFLSSNFEEDNLAYQSTKNNKTYFASYSKIRSKTMNIRENLPKTQTDNYGPWIDVFPYDNVPDDEKLRKEQYEKVMHYNRLLRFFLIPKVTDRDSGARRTFKKVMIKLNETLYKGYFFIPYLIKKRDYYATMYNDQETECCGELAYLYFKNYEQYAASITLNSHFDNLVLTKFEDDEFYALKEYDTVLTKYFGDYMELPPEEERKKHDIEYVEA